MLHVEAKKRVTHLRREQVGTFNSRLARRWERRYRIVVRKELRLEMREAAARVDAGSPYQDLRPRWQERLAKVQRPIAVEVAAAGYKTTEDMFGPGKSGAALLEGKQVVPGFGERGEMIAAKVRPNVDRWLTSTTKAMSQTTLDRVTVIVDRGRMENKTVGEIAMDIRTQTPEYTKHRGELIARSATIWNLNEGVELAYGDMGIKAKEWLTTKDELTCPWCRPMDGTRIAVGKAYFEAGAELIGDEGKPLVMGGQNINHPPLHPQCVVGETPVFAPDKLAAIVTPYCGPVVKLTLADSRRLTITPNHMFLTPFGFVKAGNLCHGDKILDSAFGKRIIGRYPNDNGEPSPIREVVGTFAESRGVSTRSVPVASEYLHGDARFCDGDIHVIAPDSFLCGGFDAMLGERPEQAEFATPYSNPPLLSRRREFAAMLLSLGLVADSIMGSRSESFAFWGRCLRHSCEHGLAAVPGSDPIVQKAFTDRCASTMELFRQCQFRYSRQISLADVLSVKMDSFTGHVYDLQTASSLYSCNGLLSSNCRCTLIPVVPDTPVRPRQAPEKPTEPVGEPSVLPGGWTPEQMKKFEGIYKDLPEFTSEDASYKALTRLKEEMRKQGFTEQQTRLFDNSVSAWAGPSSKKIRTRAADWVRNSDLLQDLASHGRLEAQKLYRGFEFNSVSIRNKFLKAFRKGTETGLPQLQSFTTSRKVAKAFATAKNRVGVIMEIDAGSVAMPGFDISKISWLDEHEIITPEGLRFTVTKAILPKTEQAGSVTRLLVKLVAT